MNVWSRGRTNRAKVGRHALAFVAFKTRPRPTALDRDQVWSPVPTVCVMQNGQRWASLSLSHFLSYFWWFCLFFNALMCSTFNVRWGPYLVSNCSINWWSNVFIDEETMVKNETLIIWPVSNLCMCGCFGMKFLILSSILIRYEQVVRMWPISLPVIYLLPFHTIVPHPYRYYSMKAWMHTYIYTHTHTHT